MILALDVGGTKVLAAPFERTTGGLKMGEVSRYRSDEVAGLDGVLSRYFAANPSAKAKLEGIGIGLAGPVLGRRVRLTNLPWSVDADALASMVGAPVFLLNDLEAHGHAVACAEPEHLLTLQAGRPRPGNQALIAAGTGLGEAFLVRHGNEAQVSPSEGGHATFAPICADDLELARFLQGRYPHVSWERVVSGLDGFRNLYDFLVTTKRISVPKGFAADVEGHQDIGAQLIKAANDGESFALTIMKWFVRLYGAEAGNLALKAMAVAGVFVGGGIVGRILPWMQDGTFIEAFTGKGRFAAMLRDIPVHIVIDPDSGVRGAANYVVKALSGASRGTSRGT